MLARATPHQIKMRNEIRTFSELIVFCDFSPVCSLNVGSPGQVLGCLTCADSWLCVGSVHSPRASECCWLCNTTRAVGAGVLLQLFQPPCFPLQKLDTPCSFHFIRHPQSPCSSTNGSSGPHTQVSL